MSARDEVFRCHASDCPVIAFDQRVWRILGISQHVHHRDILGADLFQDRFIADSGNGIIFTGQLLNYYDLTSSSYLEFRLSGAAGRNDQPEGEFNSYIGSAGIAYKWAPVGREKYRTVEWKTEFIFGNQEYILGNYRSFGFYSSIQNKLSARWWVTGRIGYSELPYDPSQNEWDYTVAIDFWQSEFVITRFQYQYNDRNIYGRKDIAGPYPSDHSFLIQVVWAMGPHKHEAY